MIDEQLRILEGRQRRARNTYAQARDYYQAYLEDGLRADLHTALFLQRMGARLSAEARSLAQRLIPSTPRELCPVSIEIGGYTHCFHYWECEPCCWCGDDTPDPRCDCNRCRAFFNGLVGMTEVLS